MKVRVDDFLSACDEKVTDATGTIQKELVDGEEFDFEALRAAAVKAIEGMTLEDVK